MTTEKYNKIPRIGIYPTDDCHKIKYDSSMLIEGIERDDVSILIDGFLFTVIKNRIENEVGKLGKLENLGVYIKELIKY